MKHRLGTMTSFFWRDEYQCSSSNFSHLHALISLKQNKSTTEKVELITFLRGVEKITKELLFVSSKPKCYDNMEWTTIVFTIEKIDHFIITEHIMNGRTFFLFFVGLTKSDDFMETFNNPSERTQNLFRLDSIIKSTEEIRDHVLYMMSRSELFNDHVESQIVGSLMEHITSELTPAVTSYKAAFESGSMLSRNDAFEDITRPQYWTMLRPQVDRMAVDDFHFEPIVGNTLKIFTIYIVILFHHMYHLESVERYARF